MTDDLQEIDGVGPAREDDLNELGYEEYSDLAEADPEELAEEVNRLTEDRALELVVQAENLTDLEEAEVETDASEDAESDSEAIEVEDEASDSDEEETAEEAADDDSEETADDSESEDESEANVVTFELGFENPMQYDTFFYTVYEVRNDYIRTNRPEQTDGFEEILDSLREETPDGTVKLEMEPQDLHDVHNAIREQIVDFQGESLMEQHDQLQEVLNRVNEVRESELF